MKKALPPIASFSPELFGYLRNMDTGKYKQFQKGVAELLGEGAVQVMYSRDAVKQDPILAAVGQLQFEVRFDLVLRSPASDCTRDGGYTSDGGSDIV